jgi:hypothetical protein
VQKLSTSVNSIVKIPQAASAVLRRSPKVLDVTKKSKGLAKYTQMSTAAIRKQAPRIARPAARYWKGKAPKGVADVDSDSDDADEAPSVEEDGDIPISGEQDIEDEGDEITPPVHSGVAKSVKSMNVSLKDVSISKDGKVIVAGREESGRTAVEAEGTWPTSTVSKASLIYVVRLVESDDDESEEDQKPPRVGDHPEQNADADEVLYYPC